MPRVAPSPAWTAPRAAPASVDVPVALSLSPVSFWVPGAGGGLCGTQHPQPTLSGGAFCTDRGILCLLCLVQWLLASWDP